MRYISIRAIAAALTALSLMSCTDSDYVPYALSGLDVWVAERGSNRSYYGGRVSANYFSRERAIAECARLALATAKQNRLDSWGYVCCTVTYSSDCETKIR